jgi:hypothetical protein
LKTYYWPWKESLRSHSVIQSLRSLSSTPIQNKLLSILHFFKFFLIISFYISLSRPLSFLYFQNDLEYHYWCLRKPSLDMTKPSQMMLNQLFLNWCYAKFVPYIIISDLISPCMATYPTEHPYFGYTHLLNILSFCSPTFCIIHHHIYNRHYVEFTF